MIITGAINHRHSFRMMRCLVLFICFLSIDARRRVEENESAEVDEDELRNAGNAAGNSGGNAAGNSGGNAGAIPPATTMSSTSTQASNSGSNSGNTGGNTGNTGGSTAQNLKCTFPDHYCNPTAPDLIRKVEHEAVTSAYDCKNLCSQ